MHQEGKINGEEKVNVAIFASGNGSNAEAIIRYFKSSKRIKISLIASNRNDAFVLQRAIKHQIPSLVFSRKELQETDNVLQKLKGLHIGFIVLAGFMIRVPANILSLYNRRIINIHPALLPGYGGKGMYGMNVHEAVISSGEKESGISIHYVNENYDEGDIIFQTKCRVDETDTPESLAEKVHKLEYEYFPEIIERVIIKEFSL